MMKPDPMPQPVLMNTVALRAVSIALRAGKVFASWASRPRGAWGHGPADNGAGAAGPIGAASVATVAGAGSVAGAIACPRRKYQASAVLSIAVRASAPQPNPVSAPSSRAPPERLGTDA